MERIDGYTELLSEATGGGVRATYRYREDVRLDEDELYACYEGDAIARRIVDRLVDDAMRSEWDLVGLDSAYDWRAIRSEADDLGLLQHVADAWKWARLQGGAILILDVDDGMAPDTPMVPAAIKRVRGLSVLDSSTVMPDGVDLSAGSEVWRRPPYYRIDGLGQVTKIHSSRVIRFDAIRLPARRLRDTQGWGPSVLQGCWRALAAYHRALDSAAHLVDRLSVMVLHLTGWRQMAMADAAEREKARNVLRDFYSGMKQHNLMALDRNDQVVEIKRSVEGIDKLLEKYLDDLVASSDTTRQIITGTQTSTGLNSDTKGEWRAWYDRVTVERRIIGEPAVTRVLETMFAARRNRGEQVPEQWTIEWSPLEQEAQPDVAARAQVWAAALVPLITAGVVTPAEARQTLIDQAILDPTELALAQAEEVPEPGIEDPALDEEAEIDPTDAVWSNDPPPDDLATAREIAEQLGVATVRVTGLAKRGEVRRWLILGKPKISLREVRAHILAENGGEA